MKKMILYTDGSSILPYSGYGLFGYTYGDEEVKASKPKGYKITNIGFLELSGKLKPHEEVVPSLYHIGAYSDRDTGTNNTGETMAIVKAIKLATKNDIEELTVFSDSTYAIGMFEKVESDNISNIVANKDIAMMMKQAYNAFNGLIKMEKVLAHSGNLGNDMADVLALYGRLYNSKKIMIEIEEDVSPKKFWNPTNDRHPFLATFKNYIFNTNDKYKNYYGLHTLASIEEAGKIDIDAVFAVARPIDNITVLDKLYDMLTKSVRNFQVPALVDIRAIYSSDAIFFRNLLKEDDGLYTYIKGARMPLTILEELEVASLVKPVGRANENTKVIKYLTNQLESYLETDSKQFDKLDITDKLYNNDSKILETINNDIVLKVDAVLSSGAKVKVPLQLKLDMPERNILKKVEKENPRVVLLLEEIDGVVRYNTVLTTDKSGSIITSNWYGNMIFL